MTQMIPTTRMGTQDFGRFKTKLNLDCGGYVDVNGTDILTSGIFSEEGLGNEQPVVGFGGG